MKSNLAQYDRIARFVLGALLVILAATGVIRAWGYVGVILLVTAFINFCPLYRLIGFSTKKD